MPVRCEFKPFSHCYPPLKDLGVGGDNVLALYVHPSRFSVWTHMLVMDFQILLSPAEDVEGVIVLALSVRPSSLRPSGYELRKADQRCIVTSLASYH